MTTARANGGPRKSQFPEAGTIRKPAIRIISASRKRVPRMAALKTAALRLITVFLALTETRQEGRDESPNF
jgi:hypothetical protein